MKRPFKKARELRIIHAYTKTCLGIQIKIRNIGKVFKEGERLIDLGVDDEQLGHGLRAFVEKIAVGGQ